MHRPFVLPPLPSPQIEPLPPGSPVGSFVLQDLLSDDPFGLRYRAKASASATEVTIEEYAPAALSQRRGDGMLRPRSPAQAALWDEGLQAFMQESERFSRLGHASLQRIGPVWQARGTAYRLLRAAVPGRSLAATCAALSEPPSEAWLRRLLAPLLDALQALHEADGLHGNIHPHSILLQANAGPVLIDPASVRLAIGARLPGGLPDWPQPAFVAPELLSPGLPVGPWTDVYALAAVARSCISGASPASAPRTDSAAPRWTEAWSTGLLAAIERASTHDAALRTQSVAEFRREIEAPPAQSSRPPLVVAASREKQITWLSDIPPLGTPGDAELPEPELPEPELQPGKPKLAMRAKRQTEAELPQQVFPSEFLPDRSSARRQPEAEPPKQAWQKPELQEPERQQAEWPRSRPGPTPEERWTEPVLGRGRPTDRSIDPPFEPWYAADSNGGAGVGGTLLRPRPRRRWPAALVGAVAGAGLTLGLVQMLRPFGGLPPALAAWVGAPSAAEMEMNARPPAAGMALPPLATAPAAPAPGAAEVRGLPQSPPLVDRAASSAPPVARSVVTPAGVAPAPPLAAAPPAVARQGVAPSALPASPLATNPSPAQVQAPAVARSVMPAPTQSADTAGTRTAQASPQRGEDLPASPAAACEPRTNFALYRCMQIQCDQTRFFKHPQCVRLRVTDQVP